MKITLDPFLDASRPHAFVSTTLKTWYDATPAVRRLWAIRPDGRSDANDLRVIVMLEPSLDGDETSPIWMAHGAAWATELRERLAGVVQLERIDGPLPDEFEIDGDGVLLSTLSWRDSTSPRN
ncbi:hypothetical protein QTI24_20780 [Variovorax sp. J22P240]|uniref:hypothetical protein n=1 Tax=Variovorax sp. J22P240 TaxID=3053514 RepID=UPI002576F3CE|nr:hypothetical protein [Variovorax sp. J22P240]MDM0001057.1 hypothetical protein [Variovorax sp. J22P240]